MRRAPSARSLASSAAPESPGSRAISSAVELLVRVRRRCAAARSRRAARRPRRIRRKQQIRIDARVHRPQDRRLGLELAQARLEPRNLARRHAVELVEHQQVGARDLLREEIVAGESRPRAARRSPPPPRRRRRPSARPARARAGAASRREAPRPRSRRSRGPERARSCRRSSVSTKASDRRQQMQPPAISTASSCALASRAPSIPSSPSSFGDHGDAHAAPLRVREQPAHERRLARAQEARDEQHRDAAGHEVGRGASRKNQVSSLPSWLGVTPYLRPSAERSASMRTGSVTREACRS